MAIEQPESHGLDPLVKKLIEEEEDRQLIQHQARTKKLRVLGDEEGQREAEKERTKLRSIVSVRASAIRMQRQMWLWAPGADGYGRIPMGELTLIVGKGGVGKSTLLSTMAAWITRGDMQGDFYGSPRDVFYVANEDSLERTVVPRMLAAGADLDRIHFIKTQHVDGEIGSVSVPDDCEAICEEMNKVGATCLMLDPLSSNLRVSNRNDAREMRGAIERLRAACERYGIASLGLAHTRKAETRNLIDAIMGSVELANVCRSAMGVMRDEDNEGSIILSQEKLNVGRLDIPSYEYRIESADAEGFPTSRIEFVGKSDKKVSDMMADAASSAPVGKTARQDAAEFILAYMGTKGGQCLRKEVVAAGRSEGHAPSTMDRAASKLGITASLSGQSAAKVWTLPTSPRLGN